jgi:hypothetical protein
MIGGELHRPRREKRVPFVDQIEGSGGRQPRRQVGIEREEPRGPAVGIALGRGRQGDHAQTRQPRGHRPRIRREQGHFGAPAQEGREDRLHMGRGAFRSEGRDARIGRDIGDAHQAAPFTEAAARRARQSAKTARRAAALRWMSNSRSTSARPACDRRPETGVGQQPLERVGQRHGIACPRDQPGLVVPDDLGDAGHVAADAGRAERHRLDQHGRQAVAVAVASDDAGAGHDRRPAHRLEDLGLRARTLERHGFGQPRAGDLGAEVRLLLALPDDAAMRAQATLGEDQHRLDQDVEPLLLDQPPHGDDLVRTRAGRAPVEFRKVSPL